MDRKINQQYFLLYFSKPSPWDRTYLIFSSIAELNTGWLLELYSCRLHSWKVPRYKLYVIIHPLMPQNKFPSSLVLTYPLAQWWLCCWHIVLFPAATQEGNGRIPHKLCHRWGSRHWRFGNNSEWWTEISLDLLCPRSEAVKARKKDQVGEVEKKESIAWLSLRSGNTFTQIISLLFSALRKKALIIFKKNLLCMSG